jgi:hypothetical protein
VPLPWPLADELSLIQSTLVFADHAHSRAVVICSVPLPPFASIANGPPVAVTAQRASVEGAVTFVDEDEQPAVSIKPIEQIERIEAYTRMTVVVLQVNRIATRRTDRLQPCDRN